MADFMVYWKYFEKDDEKLGAVWGSDWYTENERFFNQLAPGDNLWVIVRLNEEWRLLQRIRVQGLRIETDENSSAVQEYGRYHAIGDPTSSGNFDIHSQQDFAPTIRQLTFESGKQITAIGNLIGRSFQAARALSNADAKLLSACETNLTRRQRRARIPEEGGKL
jgi:hypothetical protein